jgi:hypothetical protein
VGDVGIVVMGRHAGKAFDDGVYQRVGQPAGKARQPVAERARGIAVVQQRIHLRVGHRLHLRHHRRSKRQKRRELPSGGVRIAGVADDESRQLGARAVRRMHQPGEHGQVDRCVGDRVTIEAQKIRRGIDWVRGRR